eukprot:gene24022-30316_t
MNASPKSLAEWLASNWILIAVIAKQHVGAPKEVTDELPWLLRVWAKPGQVSGVIQKEASRKVTRYIAKFDKGDLLENMTGKVQATKWGTEVEAPLFKWWTDNQGTGNVSAENARAFLLSEGFTTAANETDFIGIYQRFVDNRVALFKAILQQKQALQAQQVHVKKEVVKAEVVDGMKEVCEGQQKSFAIDLSNDELVDLMASATRKKVRTNLATSCIKMEGSTGGVVKMEGGMADGVSGVGSDTLLNGDQRGLGLGAWGTLSDGTDQRGWNLGALGTLSDVAVAVEANNKSAAAGYFAPVAWYANSSAQKEKPPAVMAGMTVVASGEEAKRDSERAEAQPSAAVVVATSSEAQLVVVSSAEVSEIMTLRQQLREQSFKASQASAISANTIKILTEENVVQGEMVRLLTEEKLAANDSANAEKLLLTLQLADAQTSAAVAGEKTRVLMEQVAAANDCALATTAEKENLAVQLEEARAAAAVAEDKTVLLTKQVDEATSTAAKTTLEIQQVRTEVDSLKQQAHHMELELGKARRAAAKAAEEARVLKDRVAMANQSAEDTAKEKLRIATELERAKLAVTEAEANTAKLAEQVVAVNASALATTAEKENLAVQLEEAHKVAAAADEEARVLAERVSSANLSALQSSTEQHRLIEELEQANRVVASANNTAQQAVKALALAQQCGKDEAMDVVESLEETSFINWKRPRECELSDVMPPRKRSHSVVICDGDSDDESGVGTLSTLSISVSVVLPPRKSQSQQQEQMVCVDDNNTEEGGEDDCSSNNTEEGGEDDCSSPVSESPVVTSPPPPPPPLKVVVLPGVKMSKPVKVTHEMAFMDREWLQLTDYEAFQSFEVVEKPISYGECLLRHVAPPSDDFEVAGWLRAPAGECINLQDTSDQTFTHKSPAGFLRVDSVVTAKSVRKEDDRKIQEVMCQTQVVTIQMGAYPDGSSPSMSIGSSTTAVECMDGKVVYPLSLTTNRTEEEKKTLTTDLWFTWSLNSRHIAVSQDRSSVTRGKNVLMYRYSDAFAWEQLEPYEERPLVDGCAFYLQAVNPRIASGQEHPHRSEMFSFHTEEERVRTGGCIRFYDVSYSQRGRVVRGNKPLPYLVELRARPTTRTDIENICGEGRRACDKHFDAVGNEYLANEVCKAHMRMVKYETKTIYDVKPPPKKGADNRSRENRWLWSYLEYLYMKDPTRHWVVVKVTADWNCLYHCLSVLWHLLQHLRGNIPYYQSIRVEICHILLGAMSLRECPADPSLTMLEYFQRTRIKEKGTGEELDIRGNKCPAVKAAEPVRKSPPYNLTRKGMERERRAWNDKQTRTRRQDIESANAKYEAECLAYEKQCNKNFKLIQNEYITAQTEKDCRLGTFNSDLHLLGAALLFKRSVEVCNFDGLLNKTTEKNYIRCGKDTDSTMEPLHLCFDHSEDGASQHWCCAVSAGVMSTFKAPSEPAKHATTHDDDGHPFEEGKARKRMSAFK